ncbi:hypothetical protein BH18ACT6_BH18ACT6_11910 [soil metagenome]
MVAPLSLFGAAFLLVVAATLVVTGVHHFIKPTVGERSLESVLGLQPTRARLTNAIAGAVELALGTGLLIAIARARFGSAIPLLALSAALLSTYVGYLTLGVSFRSGATCGCGAVANQITGWTVVRAGLLAALALLSMIWFDDLPSLAVLPILPIGAALAVIVWWLPAAMSTPDSMEGRGW